MRGWLLILLLGVVGVAAWLIMEKVRHQPSESLPSSEVSTSPERSFPAESEIPPSESSSPMQPKEASPPPANAPKPSKSFSKLTLEAAYPTTSSGCQIVRHTYYALCYDEEHEQPRWTVHILEGANLKKGKLRRTQDFRPDPAVRTGSAELSDYKRSGYDRGHLVPAADFKWDETGMSETFFLSNMSPQLHEFNAGIWEEVESTVRAWAKRYGKLVVYTGPLLNKIRGKIGKSRVSIPEAFYKVVYRVEGQTVTHAVGFIVPHKPYQREPTDFLVSVDSVEKITSIDFFPLLPDELEEKMERRVDRSVWQSLPQR
ncbi:MAG: DNA/RNA non-specific endonuclease [Bacteroidia bacterium]|nr:DNA/RNA non-specific endonuclease [Bacteroidia bacterium]MDW8235051.1 DNA/RNA non-specific endonuclease [Bacteroidia bacterium]